MVENKWLLLCCRNQTEKYEWLDSFRNERELVLRDKRNRLEITPKDRYLANMIAATCDYDRVWSNYEGETLYYHIRFRFKFLFQSSSTFLIFFQMSFSCHADRMSKKSVSLYRKKLEYRK